MLLVPHGLPVTVEPMGVVAVIDPQSGSITILQYPETTRVFPQSVSGIARYVAFFHPFGHDDYGEEISDYDAAGKLCEHPLLRCLFDYGVRDATGAPRAG